jgi:AcrR family transcriptional regulator
MSPSIINHYFGARSELDQAVVERSVARHRERFVASVETHRDGPGGADGLLRFMFGGEWHRLCRHDFITQELFAQAARDKESRRILRDNFGVFEATLRDLLAAEFPDTPRQDRDDVAYALMCLGRSNEEFIAVGFTKDRNEAALRAAQSLVAGLGRAERARPRRSERAS